MVQVALLCCAVVISLGLQAEGDPASRLASLEQVMERFYRGERLEDAVERANRGIADYNARAIALQARTEQERGHLEEALGPLKRERARLEALDKELSRPAPATDQKVLKQKAEERNALAHRVDDMNAEARQVLESYNTLMRRTKEELDRDRRRAVEAQDAVNARLAAFEAFAKEGRDAAFFIDLNQLLAEVRQELRLNPGNPRALGLLAKVRALRRELATWAMEGQARQPNGLVIVETLVGDEPCWFVVDTGAMDTIVGEEIVQAIGLGGGLGKEASLSVVGGLRVTGLACRLPRLEVAGQVRTEVPVITMHPSDVGIDGLLGQSFLKAFVYTIDERLPSKLRLVPK